MVDTTHRQCPNRSGSISTTTLAFGPASNGHRIAPFDLIVVRDRVKASKAASIARALQASHVRGLMVNPHNPEGTDGSLCAFLLTFLDAREVAVQLGHASNTFSDGKA
jgi:hypothetical protein